MATTVHAHKGDTVDAICHRVFGVTERVVEQTLELNPGLADAGPMLAEGTPVVLPAEPDQPEQPPQVQLWN